MLRTYLSAAGASVLKTVRPAPAPALDRIAGPDSPARTVRVTAEADSVARFDRAVGEPVRDVVPVTWLHAQAFGASLELMSARDFPLPVVGLVHIRNTVEQHAPVRVGETVEATVRVAALRTHPKGTEVVVTARFDVDGGTRVEETSHYLAKGARVDGAESLEQPERETFEAPAQTLEWTIAPRTADVYARVSGDVNPIHLNGLAARAFGFRGRIIHGMYTAAHGLAAAQVRADAFTWEVEFATPITLPARVAAAVRRDGAVTRVDVWDRKRGKPHMLSTVTERA